MKIDRIIFICKKKLIRLIERIPTQLKDQSEEEKNAPFSTILQISGHLLRNLPIKDDSVRFIASYAYADAKSYYLYAVVSEVLSSCMSCMRVASWVEDSEEEILFGYPKMNPGNETISGGRISHLLHESIIDEFEVRFRKLQEFLCNLVCFSETNEQEYYQLFFAAEGLTDIKYANQDITEFFGNPIENFTNQSKDLLSKCNALVNKLDKNKCWFLRPGATFDLKDQSIISSYRQRYKKALSIATDGEKIVLGPTYKVGYGGSSKSAHALIDEHFKDYSFEDVKHVIHKIPVICLNILQRAFQLANIECPKNFKGILECAASGEGATIGIENVTRRKLDVGDLVTTDLSDVAEILEVNISKYGYKSYRVRYLINPKIKEISEEWLPPRYIGPCLLKKKGIRNLFVQKVSPIIGDKTIDWIQKQSEDALYTHAKTVVIKMAKEGHLKLVFKAKSKKSAGMIPDKPLEHKD